MTQPTRRDALAGLMLTLGGGSIVSACSPDANEDDLLRSLRLSGRRALYNGAEYRLVGIVADAIIPRTETPGAIDAGVPAYLDAMMKNWASDDTQRLHRRSLREIRARLEELGGARLERLSDEARRSAVASLDREAYAQGSPPAWLAQIVPPPPAPALDEPVVSKYRALKVLVASVYYATEEGATQELQYEPVPGRWLGNAPLSEIGRTWAE